ncbi:hypothetical protein JCM16408A_48540 [Methylobacterium phyllosphaerae]
MDLEAVGESHEPQIAGRETAEEALHGRMADKTLAEVHVTRGAAGRPPDQFRIEFDRAWSSPRPRDETIGPAHNHTFEPPVSTGLPASRMLPRSGENTASTLVWIDSRL